MREIISSGVDFLNHFGQSFCDFAGTMLVQVTILVAVMLVLELLLRNRVRAVVRYWLWLLVLVKLVLPINLHTPASLAYWLPAARPQAESAQSTPAHGPPAPPVARPTQFTTPADELDATSSRTDFIPFPSRHDRPDAAPTARPTPATKPALEMPRLQWPGALFGLWILGVLSLLTIVGRRALWVGQMVRQATNAPTELHEQLRDCLSALEMAKRRVSLKISDHLGSPAICGLWRPTILLPRGFPCSLDREQVRMVFIHEVVHWRRGDLVVNCIQTLLQIIYFYNPAVWLANLFIRRLREQAVDETVLVAAGGQPNRYASTLLDLAAAPLRPLEATLRLTGVIESRNAIAARIKRITFLPIPKTAKLGLAGLAAVTIVGTALLPMGRRERAFADDQPSKKVQNAVPMHDPSVVQTKPPPSARDSSAAKSPTLPAATSKSASEKRVTLTVTGRAKDSAGKPIAGAIIHLRAGANPELMVTTTSHSDGSYEFKDIQVMLHQANGTGEQLCSGPLSLDATAPGFGFAWSGRRYFWDRKKLSDEEIGHDQWTKRTVKTDFFRDDPPVIDLEFAPAASLKGRVIDDDHQPIAGADVSLWDADYLNGEGKPLWIEYRKFSEMRQALKREQIDARTDRDGRFEIGGLPAEVCFLVQVEHAGDANTSFYAATTDRPLTVHHFNNSATTFRGNMQVEIAIPEQHEIRTGDLTIVLHHARSVLIDVVEDDTGRPAANVRVSTNSVLGQGPSAYGKTNGDGRVELKLPIGQYQLTADPPRDSLYVRTRATLDGTAGRDKEPFTIRLVKGCIVHFEAVDLESGKGIEGIGFQAQEVTPAPPYRPVPPGHSVLVDSTTGYADNPRTDKDGRMRAVMQPGTYKFTAAPQWLGRHNVGDEYESGFAPSPTRLPSGETVEVKLQLKRKPTAVNASIEKATESDPPDSKPAAGGGSQAATQDPSPAVGEATLSGRLVDETGNAVTDARIELMSRRTFQSLKAKSDANGNYRIMLQKDFGEYQIEIHSNRWVGITDRQALPHVDVTEGSQVVRDFTLPRACRLRIQTVDEQGKPIRDVQVFSSLSDENQNFAAESMTDKQGWASLEGLRSSDQERLVATMTDGYAFAHITLKLHEPAAVTEQRMVLQKGQDVKGTALCSDGKPAASWRINAMPTWWHFGRSPMGQAIRSDGSFTLRHVAAEKYDVIVDIPSGEGMSLAKPVLTAVALPPAREPLAVTVDYPSPASMATISGQIEFTGGTLQRGFHISAYSVIGHYSGDAFLLPGQTEFKIGPVPRGTYRLEFNSSEIEPLALSDVVIPSDKLHVKLNVRGTLVLRGTVVRQDTRKPVTRFRAQVSKLRTLSGPNYVQGPTWHEFHDDRGAFAIDVAGPGIYTVLVAADGLASTRSEPFNTDKDGQKEIRVELKPAVSLSGTVVDELGHRVDGAKIILLPGAVQVGGIVARTTPGDEVAQTRNGAFTIPDFTPGQGLLRVVHPDFSPSIVETNSVNRDGQSAPLRIVLHPGATVHGHVYDEFGKPEANVVLHFQDQSGYGGNYTEDLGRMAHVVTDQSGYYEARHLPDQFCYVKREDLWRSFGVVRQAILATNGRTQTLDLGGTSKLTGRLIVNGAPLANARVQLSDDNPTFGIFKAYARTDERGVFAFYGPAVGTHTLYRATSAQSDSWVRVKDLTVTAKGGDLGTIDAVSVRLVVRFQPPGSNDTDGLQLTLEEYNSIWPFGNRVETLRPRQSVGDPFVFEQVPLGKYELVCARPNQFMVRKIVELKSPDAEQDVTLDLPPGTASLHGKLAGQICGPDGCRSLKVWSNDQRLLGGIVPKEDGTYKLDNVPAGEYAIKELDTRDAETLLTVSVRDGENKTLNITPETVASRTPPTGFIDVRVFTPDGVPISGPDIRFEGSKPLPTLTSSQEARLVFVGSPGSYDAEISFPGFNPVHRTLELKPVGKGGVVVGSSQVHVQLQPRQD